MSIVLVVASLGAVLGHDVACNLDVPTARLCQRDDGSRWRDHSHGCVDDNECQSWRLEGEVDECLPSRRVAEPAATSCAWLLEPTARPARPGIPPD